MPGHKYINGKRVYQKDANGRNARTAEVIARQRRKWIKQVKADPELQKLYDPETGKHKDV